MGTSIYDFETDRGPERIQDVPLVEFMYQVVTRTPGESYRRSQVLVVVLV